MFFYNWLFHAQRPEPDQFFEEDEQETTDQKLKHQQQEQNDENLTKTANIALECQQPPLIRRQTSTSASFFDDESHKKSRKELDGYEDDDESILKSIFRNKLVFDDETDSVLSTGSGRIRYLQSQIQNWSSCPDEDPADMIPPMPKIPFVSMDLKLESTESSEDDDDGEDELDEIWRQLLETTNDAAASLCANSVVSNKPKEVAAAATEDDCVQREESNHDASKPALEDVSLSMEDLVPLRDEDMNSTSNESSSFCGDGLSSVVAEEGILMNMKENKPQSFLLDYLSSNHNNSDTFHCSKTSSSPLRQPLKQLLEKHANSQQQEQPHFSPSNRHHHHNLRNHHLAEDADPIATNASTPYHLWVQQHQNSFQRQQHHRHPAHNNRCQFPSQISVPVMADSDHNDDDHNDDDGMEEQSQHDEILDPTDPLICGKMDHSPYVKTISDRMNHFLMDTDDADIEDVCREALDWIRLHPMVCQVKYHPPDLDNSLCLPLHYFSAAGWLQGCQAAYEAFPEAIGLETSHVGLPLHYACLHNQANHDVVAFLVSKFPDAARFTNQEYHQTPLHLACQSSCSRIETIQLLLEHYPTAAQLADAEGFTPLHYAVQHRLPLDILQALQASGPAVIGAATKTWQKPLHLAALHGGSLQVLEWLLANDKRAAACTLDDFSTPLHCAVTGWMNKQNNGDNDDGIVMADSALFAQKLTCLRDAHPDAIGWTNAEDQTPYDLAVAMGLEDAALLDILKPPFS